MAAFGQTFDSNAWLRNARTQLVYPRIAPGARTSAGDVIWVAWWLTPWVLVVPPFYDQARYIGIRSTWITMPPGRGFSSAWPLLQHQTAEQGPTVWNNWWWNTPYVPPAKLGIFAGGAPYTYAGGAATLGAQRNFQLVGSGASYAYAGAPANSDFGIELDVLPYNIQGEDISFIGRSITFSAGAGIYVYSGGVGTKFRPLKGLRQGPILTTSTRMVFGPKRVSEEIAALFDFSNKTVSGDVLSLPVVTVTVWRGVDSNPQALYQGSSLISGTTVYVTLVDGVAGVIYQIETTVTASLSGILSLMGFLTVLPDSL